MGDVDIADQPRNIIGLIIGQESLSGGGLLFFGLLLLSLSMLTFLRKSEFGNGSE